MFGTFEFAVENRPVVIDAMAADAAVEVVAVS